MKKHIPNILTLGNLICGVLAIRAVFQYQIDSAIMFIGIAAVLDFFDGLVARLLGVSGELGKQLDSLADNVTFGVAPGVMLLAMANYLDNFPDNFMGWVLFGSCLLVPAMAAMRLAIFNIDTRQSTGFIGMPTPANTLMIASLYYLDFNNGSPTFFDLIFDNAMILAALAFLFAIWQVLPIKLIALKFKNWSFRENFWRYIFLVLSAIILVFLRIAGIPLVILVYFFVSILANRANS